MASTLHAEDLMMYEPWPHIVNSLDPHEFLPELTEEILQQFHKLEWKNIPYHLTDRGHARKLQHIVNFNNTVTDVALDPGALPMRDYADAGLMWHAWNNVYGRMISVEHFSKLRPHEYAKYSKDRDRGSNYGLKMTYWKDTLQAKRSASWFSLPRKHTLLRFMMYVHPKTENVFKTELGIWSNERQRDYSYLSTYGFGITYNPDNEKHLMDLNISINNNNLKVKGRRRDFQASWLMYEIIKNDIED